MATDNSDVETGESDAQDTITLPEYDGEAPVNYRHIRESISLALYSEGVSESDILTAIQTVDDAVVQNEDHLVWRSDVGDREGEQRIEEQREGVTFNVDTTNGSAEINVTVTGEEIEELPESWDAEQFAAAQAKQLIEQDLQNIYSLARVKTMVNEMTREKGLPSEDTRHFEVWAKW